jgi:hypothetical protein
VHKDDAFAACMRVYPCDHARNFFVVFAAEIAVSQCHFLGLVRFVEHISDLLNFNGDHHKVSASFDSMSDSIPNLAHATIMAECKCHSSVILCS